MHVGSQTAVARPQPEDSGLLLSGETLHLIFKLRAVFFSKPGLEVAPDQGFTFPVGDWQIWLLFSAACLCKCVSLIVPGQATMSRDLLYNNLRVLA